MRGELPGSRALCNRYLKAAFDYTYTAGGLGLLLHPGYTDLTRIPENPITLNLPPMMGSLGMVGAAAMLLPEETDAYSLLLGEMQTVTRPEISPIDAVDDLRLLAKLGVPYEDQMEVLSSYIYTEVKPSQRAALQQVNLSTPRWKYAYSPVSIPPNVVM